MPHHLTALALIHRLPVRVASCVALALALAAGVHAQPVTAPVAAAASSSRVAADVITYGQREDVMRFAAEVAERQELDLTWVRERLAESRFLPVVTQLILPPEAGTAKNWTAYRARFVEPMRLKAGLAFWNKNEKWLLKAQEIYGIPPEIIVGILGVETIYGKQMGTFKVIDALATLSFDFPKERRDRTDYFREELEQFLVLCRSEDRNPQTVRGSYAGAMGMGQFMPSSWNKYAVDFDGDGKFDLNRSAADVIGSVAHYLSSFGWQPEQALHFEVAAPVDSADRAALLAPDILPSFTAQQFSERGAKLSPAGAAFEGLLALVELQNGHAAPTYIAGTPNFYTVTRYNRSSYYAMAVIELGQELARLRKAVR